VEAAVPAAVVAVEPVLAEAGACEVGAGACRVAEVCGAAEEAWTAAAHSAEAEFLAAAVFLAGRSSEEVTSGVWAP